MRVALIVCIAAASTGQAMASEHCQAASARWLEMATPELETALGEPVESVMQDPEKRWRMVANSYIGSALAFSPDRSNVAQAETVVVLDTLVDCLQGEVPEIDRIDGMYPPEKREAIREAAEKIMKGGN